MVELRTQSYLPPEPVSESPAGDALVPQLPQIDVPRDNKGRVMWRTLRTDPDKLKATLEQEAERYHSAGIPLNQDGLQAVGARYLVRGIRNFYPGGMFEMQDRFGIPHQRPKNFWKDPENIEAEARRIISGGHNLYQKELGDIGQSSFVASTIRNYPGGWRGLKQSLGVEVTQKPHGYWTPERILHDAREFQQLNGSLTQRLLQESDRHDLIHGINRHYPGGFTAIKAELGLKTIAPHHFWTPEEIRKAALDFLEEEGNLSMSLLPKRGRGDLRVAIGKYPGRMQGLKRDLHLDIKRSREKGYWTSENIEREAREFFEKYGQLSATHVMTAKQHGLLNAITRRYPGGFAELRKNLGIVDIKEEPLISTEQANSELSKLLEGEL